MYIAGVDMKAAFDVVGPEAYGKTTLSQGHTHGWITAALSREMGCMKGHGTFETIEKQVEIRACHTRIFSRVHVVKMFEDCCGACESKKSSDLIRASPHFA